MVKNSHHGQFHSHKFQPTGVAKILSISQALSWLLASAASGHLSDPLPGSLFHTAPLMEPSTHYLIESVSFPIWHFLPTVPCSIFLPKIYHFLTVDMLKYVSIFIFLQLHWSIDFGCMQQEVAACNKQQQVVTGSRVLVSQTGVLTTGPQGPAVRAKFPSLACLVKNEFRRGGRQR